MFVESDSNSCSFLRTKKGMFEHVGSYSFPAYFQKVDDLLKPDGIGLINTIGTEVHGERTPPWTEKYIFPGK